MKRSLKPTSFISERTAEYILVPEFKKILAKRFKTVIPLFYWASREGGVIANECCAKSKFTLVVLYPRRPKVTSVGNFEITVKFNMVLFYRTKEFNEFGVPVFAGVPRISNLLHLNSCTTAWFNLKPSGEETSLVLPVTGTYDISNSSLRQMDETEILSYIDKISVPLEWNQIKELIRTSKRQHNLPFYFGGIWGDTYKPVYFLVKNEE